MRNRKLTVRWMSGLLAMLLWAGCIIPVKSADAAVVLPGMLTELGDEAFLGDYQVDGHVTLPSGMKTLGRDVFEGTRLYALTVPAGVDVIPAQSLSGAAYVRLLGADTGAENGAFSGVAYVFGPADSVARQQAAADGAVFLCDDALVAQDGFWYQVENGEATLICAVDNLQLGSSVRVPAALEDGTPVTALASTATLRLRPVTKLELPHGIREESGCFDGCPDAVISYYGDTFCVTSLRANRSSVSVGAEVTWIASTNSTGAVEYYFEVNQVTQSRLMLISRSDGFRSSLLYEDSNMHAVVLDEPGVYVARVVCRDEAGTEVSAESEAVVVNNHRLTVTAVTSDVLAGGEGCDVTWTAATEGGNGEIRYHWQLLRDGEVIADLPDSDSPVYTLSGAEAGEYSMRLSAGDDLTETAVARAEKVYIYAPAQAAPEAPHWTDAPFAAAEADAPTLEAEGLTISWESVDYAAQYGVIVALQLDGVWTEVVHQRISGSRSTATISAGAFADVTADTPCRISLYSVNLEEGEQRHYYAILQPHVVDEGLTIEGGYTSRLWYEAYYGAATRTFTVESELPWTVTAQNGAEWVSWEQDEGTLVVRMAENETAEILHEKLTISNGVNSATITLRHYVEHVAPQIIAPVCSTSSKTPTVLPMAPFELTIARNGGYNMQLFICQQAEDGTFTTLVRVPDVGESYVVDPEAIGLVPGRTVRFNLYGYYNTYSNTVNRTALSDKRYVVLEAVDDGPTVGLPSGGTKAELVMAETEMTLPITFTGSTPTVTSNADWLTGTVDEDAKVLRITGSVNASAEARLGMLTLTNGSDVVQVAVSQSAHLPEVLAPLTLSETEEDRTRLYIQSNTGVITLLVRGEQAVLYNTETAETVFTAANSTSEPFTVSVSLDAVETSDTHTLTVTGHGMERVFYCYFSKNTSKVYFADGLEYASAAVPASGGSVSTTFTASSSWTAATEADWLTLSVTSGKSVTNQALTVTAAANDAGMPREADVIITRGNVRATLHITQEAGVAIATLKGGEGDPASLAVPGYCDDRAVKIAASGSWTLTADVDWIFFNSACTQTSLSGSGSDTVDVYGADYYGTEPRSGSLLLTCGDQRVTLPVVQYPYSAFIIMQPDLSEDTVNTLKHGDLTFTWAVDDAWIDTYTFEISVPINEAGDMRISEYVIPANGTGSYTFTLPASLCVPDTGETCYVRVMATNPAMPQGTLFDADFLLVSGAAVLVDAKPRTTHSGVSDVGGAFTHTITSEGTWTATSSAPWLTVSSASGETGAALTVTAAANYGTARTGVVTLRCGTYTATITVEQYPALTPYPTLNGEGLSTSIRSPMLIPASTTTLTYTYDVEPAAYKYIFELWEVEEMRLIGTVDEVEATYDADDDNLNRMIRSSGLLVDNENAGNLNFTGLTLQPGHLYCLNVERRTSGDGRSPVSTAYWFYTDSGSSASLYLDSGTANADLTLATEDDFSAYTVHCDGTWYATTNVDWLMVGSEFYSREELTEEGRTSKDYTTFVSADDRLVVAALANESGASRTGVVTLRRFGGNETATISVTQPKNCAAAALTSPALNNDASDPVTLPLDANTFRWNASEDSAGKYTLTVREKTGRSYFTVYEYTAASCSQTVPVSVLKENAEYLVYLDTWADETCTLRRTYRFRTGYENELSLVADVEWQDDEVDVYAQASGGSGSGYQYAFILYCDGEIVESVPWDSARNNTSFSLTKAGLWQVEVCVMDGQGQEKRVIVSEKTLDAAVQPTYIRLSGANWLAPVEGGSTSLTVYASGEWQCTSGANWLHASSASGTTGAVTVTAFANDTGVGRSAALTFTCGAERVVFSVTQQAREVSADASISLNLTQWAMADAHAASIPVAVSATEDWLISSCPDWIIPSAVSGSGESLITLYCEPNRGAGRNGTVTFLCGAAEAELAVSQPSENREPATAAFTMDLTTVATGVPVTFTVTAQNATDVVLMVDNEKYESYPVTDGAATFTRAFSTEGTRSVQLVPMNGAVAGVTIEPQELTVFSKGKLASPVLNAIDPVVLGAGATVSWTAVPNAESYTADLYLGTVKIATQTMTADVTSVTFSADKLVNVGQYTLVVLATAAGYDQSETGMFVDVFYPQVNFSIVSPLASYVYVPADTIDIQVENPSGYYIAVKVTDEHGNVTYLPENRGTVNDTYIQGVLQYAPLDAGEITIQAMAYPTAQRGSDEDAWFDASHNVTCTVNGPIVSRILINGEMGAVRMSDDMQTLTVTANNGVDTIRVELDGQPLGVIKNGVTTTDPIPYDSEVNFVRTFSCTLPAATEGFHAYAVVGTDAEGRTHRLTYRFYVVKPCEEFTVYAQTREDVILSLPSDSADDADGVSMIQPLTVVGSCGNMYYILYERTYALFFKEMAYGFIPKAQAGTEQKLDTEYGNIYCYSPISAQYSYIGAEDAIMFRWAPAGIDMPDAAEYHVYYRMVGETTWRLIGTTREKSLRFDISDLGIGEYEFAVTVSYNGTNSHHNEFAGHLTVFETATECAEVMYKDTESGGYHFLYSYVVDWAFSAEFVGYSYLTSGVRDEVYLSAAKLYDALGENSVLDSSVGAQYRMVTGILEQLAVTNPDTSVGWVDSLFRFVDALDKAAFATDFLDKLMTEAKYEDAKLRKISTWLVTNNPKEVFADGRKVYSEVTYLGNAMINFVRYDMIPDEDLLLVADCLSRSPDPNMQEVARMLRELTTPDGLAAFVISGCGLEVADMIEAAGTDWFISLLSSTPVSKALVGGAFFITEDLLNTSEINRAAYLCNENLDVLEAYLPIYSQITVDFWIDPMTYYEDFVNANTTYYMLLQLANKSLLEWMDVESEATVNRVLNFLDHHYSNQQEAIKRHRDDITWHAGLMDERLEALYDEVLRHFGIPHVDFVIPK